MSMREEPSPELLLAAACCRWPSTPASADLIQRRLTADIDWQRFLQVVHRHRIEALVWAGARNASVALPEHIFKALADKTAGIAIANLEHAAEENRLFHAFQASGLELVFVKGTTVALLAYGSLAVKSAWDIDLLVSKGDLDHACAVLAALGYERRTPGPALSGKKYGRWLEHSKEMVWIDRSSGVAVELHIALVDNPELLPTIGMRSPRQMVRHGAELILPTFAMEELFAYLCVHGMVHHWRRLKWLADVAALVETNGLDWEQLYRSSLALGAGRCGAVALLLSERFFGTVLPSRLTAELRADQAVALLERSSIAAMALCESRPDDEESAWELIKLMAAGFFAKPGLRHFLAELRRRFLFPYSPKHPSVWTPLWPILTLLQLPRFVLKRMRLRRGGLPPRSAL